MSTTELATVGSSNGHITTMFDQIKDPLEFIKTMGTALAQSQVAGVKNAGQGQIMVWACLSKKKDPFEIAQRYHLIEGKLAIKAEQMLADFRTKFGGKSEWIKTGTDGVEAEIKLTGQDGQVIQYAFNVSTARSAGYVKDGSQWKKRPDQMLRSRCITDAIRMGWPEISGGNYSEEEIYDVNEDFKSASTATSAKRTTKSAATTTTDPVIDVTAEPAKSSAVAETVAAGPTSTVQVEQPPFDVDNNAGDSDESTIEADVDTSFDPVSLEIQMIIDKLGSSVAQICKTFNGKLGTTASRIDDFTEEHRTAILEKLRAALAKFEQQKIELLPN